MYDYRFLVIPSSFDKVTKYLQFSNTLIKIKYFYYILNTSTNRQKLL